MQALIEKAINSGSWMIRRTNSDGTSYNGFRWNPIGEWTEAPDWNQKPCCGGGLHGNGPNSTGFWGDGARIDFCIIEDIVDIDGEKIKCRRAMILMSNQLPDGLSVGGDLCLEGTQITQLPDGLSVGGSLDLRGTQITQLPDGLSVGGYLYLRGTQLTQLPDGLSVGERIIR